MTDYKPIMTQATDFYMRASSWRKLISICFHILSYVFLEMIKRASHELYIWAKLVALNRLFLVRFGFFFKIRSWTSKKKFNQKVFLWLRQEPFLTMIDETQPNSLSAIVFLNY